MREKLVIFGAGGHAAVTADAVECGTQFEVAFFAETDPVRIGASFAGYPIRTEEDGLAAVAGGLAAGFVAIGSNDVRRRLGGRISNSGGHLAVVIHPSATVARSARIGAGTLVAANATVNPNAVVGSNVVVNTGAIVEHDCVVGDGAHIGPHATLCGGVQVGEGCLIGAGATVLVGVRVADDAIVGAGATVLADVGRGMCVMGTPARVRTLK